MTRMKQYKTILLSLTFTICVNVFSQQAWHIVGKPGFSPDAKMAAMSLDSKGTPYVIFQEYFPRLNEVTVMKYHGGVWNIVGNPRFSIISTTSPGIAFGDNDTPYVVYGGYRATVMKYDGNEWVVVGDGGFSAGGAQYTTLVMDKQGIPYVGFSDMSDGLKATVLKFNGGDWVSVGLPGFTAGKVIEPKLVLHNDTPYVVFRDGLNSEKLTVMKYNGISWAFVGEPGFTAGAATSPSIAINSKGVPYVFYSDISKGQKGIVMQFKDTNWEIIGSGFTAAENLYTTINIFSNDTPYIAFTNLTNGKANVMKYDGVNWLSVGNKDFSLGKVDYLSFTLDSNQTPYVVFLDRTFTDLIGRITVMRYANVTELNPLVFSGRDLVQIYPNPAVNYVDIAFTAKEQVPGSISVIDAMGRIVKTELIQSVNGNNNCSIDLNHVDKGIYVIQVQLGIEIISAKLVLE